MRWLTYTILAYLALGIQTGVGAFVRVESASGNLVATPNFVLLAVVFIAINAPRDAALIGAVVMGLLQDVTTGQRFGLFGLAYGLVAFLVVGAQSTVYREHPLTQFTATLISGVITSIVLLIGGWIRGPAQPSPLSLFAGALYTAILAPILIGIMQRFKKAFSFQPPRRSLRLR
jgi:rod shape-determining protein MreD